MNEDKEGYKTMLSADYMTLKSNQSKKTGAGTGRSTALVEIKPNVLSLISDVDNNCSLEESRTVHELISSEQELTGLCSVSDSDKRNVPPMIQNKNKQLSFLPFQILNNSPSNDLGTTQNHGSLEQQQHDQNLCYLS
ncbi:hypothetical protein Bca101_008625 [Brassica carinata]